ncbi:MAG: phosphatidylserine/phosphatidylglycerophosphate/cardiolipin synthase family protein [Bacteroidetes bacterium]|nr:phosphatidylserine/phosphatidylglycerophosphate/cardiolipin synthase family protein [Bacteroidota bacterium]
MSAADTDQLTLLRTGSDGFDALLDLIDRADDSLRLLFYTFKDDSCGKEVVNKLVGAASRGVTVSLLIDDFGSIETPDGCFDALVEAGGSFRKFQPRLLQRYLLRNHQKIAIADDGRGIIGSFNIAETHLSDESEEGWRDIGVRIDGPAMTRLTKYYDSLWDWVGRERPSMRALADILEQSNEDEGDVRWVVGGPSRGHNHYVRQVRAELRSAECVDMIMAYFAPSPRVLAEVRRVARDGCLRLITAAKTDVKMSRAAARHTYGKLLKAGAEIYEYQPRLLHTKLIITDNAVFIGSGNFDVRSLYVNLEIMLRVERADFRDEVLALFEDELKDSERIDVAKLKQKATPVVRLFWRMAYWLTASVDRALSRRFAR